MNNERLQRIYFEAGRLFIRKGYPDTKMTEIAKAAGIAVGTMYSVFTGKEAVFSFVILATLDRDYFRREITLPVRPVEESFVMARLEALGNELWDSVMRIQDEEGRLCKDFLSLMGELFDLYADNLLAFDNLERNPDVMRELGREYRKQKNKFFGLFAECLERYIHCGQIRYIEYVPAHVPFLVDTLTWWAMNSARYIPQAEISSGEAKDICLDIIGRAYGT